MGEVQGQGYVAQALDVADILAVSYFHALASSTNPSTMQWIGTSRIRSSRTTGGRLLQPHVA